MRRWKSLVLVIVQIASVASAEVYKWTDTQGNVHYGDHPPVTEAVEQLHIEKGKTDSLPSISPELKSLPEESASISQQRAESEDRIQTEYKFPVYQCFDSYPGDLSSIDVRPDYASHTLTDVEINSLTQLFKTLNRNWRGDVATIECLGTTNKPREKKQYFTARISGSWSMTGQLELEIDYHNKEKSSRQHYYWWLIENSRLYFGDRRDIRAALEWVMDLKSVSSEKLAFSKLNYRPNVRQIQVKEVVVISRTLYMTELLYTNGVLTSIYKWRLT